MDIIAITLIGWLAGWLLLQAADYLPRFAVGEPPAIYPSGVGLRYGVPLAGGGTAALLWISYGASWQALVLAAGFTFLVLIAVIDLKYRLVLNVMVYPAVVLVLVGQLAGTGISSALIGGVWAFGIFYLTSRVGDLGSGDVKLAGLLGLLYGFPHILWVLIVGGGAGALTAAYLLTLRRGDRATVGHIPYAPFLCLGAMLYTLYTLNIVGALS